MVERTAYSPEFGSDSSKSPFRQSVPVVSVSWPHLSMCGINLVNLLFGTFVDVTLASMCALIYFLNCRRGRTIQGARSVSTSGGKWTLLLWSSTMLRIAP
jgi:hypothetical protein